MRPYPSIPILPRRFRGAPVSPLVNPSHPLDRCAIALPELDAIRMRAGHDAHPLRLAVKARVFEKASHINRGIVRPHVEPHKAIGGMAQRGLEESSVLREKSDAPMPGSSGRISGSLVPRRAISRPIWRKGIRHARSSGAWSAGKFSSRRFKRRPSRKSFSRAGGRSVHFLRARPPRPVAPPPLPPPAECARPSACCR